MKSMINKKMEIRINKRIPRKKKFNLKMFGDVCY